MSSCIRIYISYIYLVRRALFVIQGSYSHYSESLTVLFRKHAPTRVVWQAKFYFIHGFIQTKISHGKGNCKYLSRKFLRK